MDYIKYFPKPFLDDLVQGRCVPIIGAGFSKNANIPAGKKMPLWEDLGKGLANSLQDYEYSNAIDAISAYSHEFSRAKLIEALHESLYVDSASPGDTHKAFCDLHFELVVTTNIEFLLDRSYEASGKYCHPIIDENQLAIDSKGPKVNLLKLHGDIHHPNRLVVDEEDYNCFLERYPLISTYLANLLICKTAFFIGYSLDDPDFRQVWQIIADRLGKLRRTAYTVMVNASQSTIARFERRGVKVINLAGDVKDYPEILTNVFKSLRAHWNDYLLKNSTTTKDDSLAELALPSEAPTRMCFVAVPLEYAPYYKKFIFPIAYRYGFTPILGYDILSPGDNVTAKITSFIERAEIIIVDPASAGTQFEARLALKSRAMKEGRLLIISEKHSSLSSDISKFTQISRLPFPFDEVDTFLNEVETWFEKISSKLEPIFEEEPERLLQKKEYRASVISAFTLFEHELRVLFEDDPAYSSHYEVLPLRHLLNFAMQSDVIGNKDEYNKVREAMQLRNRLVHSNMTVSSKQTREVVSLFMKLSRKIKQLKTDKEQSKRSRLDPISGL